MGELAHPGASDHDESWCADVWNKVQGQEDDQLDDLDHAPWVIFGAAGGLAEHFDRVRRVTEEESVWRNKVDEPLVNQCSLFGKLWLALPSRYAETMTGEDSRRKHQRDIRPRRSPQTTPE